MLEREVEEKLRRAVEARGGLCWKFVSPSAAGVPDRIILLPRGRLAFAELKAPSKKPRPLQVYRINQLRTLGFCTLVIDDPEKIGEILDEI